MCCPTKSRYGDDWIRDAKNSQAEVDYVDSLGRNVLPIEVKAGMKGRVKSLWIFMREKNEVVIQENLSIA